MVDAGGRLVGLITLADLTTLAAEPELEGIVCAADVMRPPVSLSQDDLLGRALDLMMSMGVRELPVIDRDQRVLGLIDEAAIARAYMRAHATPVDPAVSGVIAVVDRRDA